jgi:hypothetical protein
MFSLSLCEVLQRLARGNKSSVAAQVALYTVTYESRMRPRFAVVLRKSRAAER